MGEKESGRQGRAGKPIMSRQSHTVHLATIAASSANAPIDFDASRIDATNTTAEPPKTTHGDRRSLSSAGPSMLHAPTADFNALRLNSCSLLSDALSLSPERLGDGIHPAGDCASTMHRYFQGDVDSDYYAVLSLISAEKESSGVDAESNVAMDN